MVVGDGADCKWVEDDGAEDDGAEEEGARVCGKRGIVRTEVAPVCLGMVAKIEGMS